jgi:hypothetical protein
MMSDVIKKFSGVVKWDGIDVEYDFSKVGGGRYG